MPLIILSIGLLYFLAHGLTHLFRLSRIPDVLILILLGVTAGPVLGFIKPSFFGAFGGVLTTVALTVILFESGTTMKLDAVTRSLGPTSAITIVSYFATAAIVWIGAQALGLSSKMSLVSGAILGGTSSAVVIPLVRALKISEKPATILMLESAITDVLCIVISFGLIDSIHTGTMEPIKVLRSIGMSFFFSSAIGILGGVIWLKILRRVREGDATLFTTISSAFVLYGATELMGLSGGIAVLCFGISLANAPAIAPEAGLPDLNTVERMFFGELVFLLKTFFFLFLGLSIQLDNLRVMAGAAIVSIVIYATRFGITRFTLPTSGVYRRDAVLAAFLVPKGLAAAVLAGIPAQRGIPEGDLLQSFVYSVVLISIVLTALLVIFSERPTMKHLFSSLFKKFRESE